MALISAISFLTVFLIVWFHTEAFEEYGNLFLPDSFHLPEYKEVKESVPDMSYQDFLLEYHNSFFTRLITCPICISIWVGSFLSIFVGISLAPIIILSGLVLYLVLKRTILE